MSNTTLSRLKKTMALEDRVIGDIVHNGDIDCTNEDIQITVKDDNEIIEEMDKKSIIEIIQSMKSILIKLYPRLSYCEYGSGFCTTDVDRNEEEREINHAWPGCTSCSMEGAAYVLIDKAIEILVHEKKGLENNE